MLPVVIQNLPLKEDLEENKTVYGCIVCLFEASNPIVSVPLSLPSLPPFCLGDKPYCGIPDFYTADDGELTANAESDCPWTLPYFQTHQRYCTRPL